MHSEVLGELHITALPGYPLDPNPMIRASVKTLSRRIKLDFIPKVSKHNIGIYETLKVGNGEREEPCYLKTANESEV